MNWIKRKFYLSKFENTIFVLKIGGEVIESKQILDSIVNDIQELLSQNIKIILVHGGGTQADTISKQLGHTPTKIKGRRVTGKKDLEIIKMLYGGTLNLDILSALKKAGLKGMRVSGVDGDLLKVKLRSKRQHDYGFVGDIQKVQPQVLFDFLKLGYVPVIPSLAALKDGTIVNVNADTIATEVAISLQTEKLILFTNVDGVYDGTSLLSFLNCSESKKLIENKVVQGGMAVKIQNCIAAVKGGVKRVHIINGLSEHSLLNEVLTKQGIGTMIVSDKEKKTYLHE